MAHQGLLNRPSMRPAIRRRVVAAILGMSLVVAGCATALGPMPERLAADHAVAFGRALAVVTGPRTRSFQPKIGFLELENQSTGERWQVKTRPDGLFVLDLPAGRYELSRVEIREGPFMSLANLRARFEIGAGSLTYLGTWRFGVDSPRYGRMVVVSAVYSEEDQAKAEELVVQRYPDLGERVMTAQLPDPAEAETRLYEVMPYPRYPRYFQRHNW